MDVEIGTLIRRRDLVTIRKIAHRWALDISQQIVRWWAVAFSVTVACLNEGRVGEARIRTAGAMSDGIKDNNRKTRHGA
jgi:hypothetical protein